LTFDLESRVRVTCDVSYLCSNFSLPRPLCSRLRPDVRDRQTDVRQHHCLMPRLVGGHNNAEKELKYRKNRRAARAVPETVVESVKALAVIWGGKDLWQR